MGSEYADGIKEEKKTEQTVRELNTPMLILRAVQLGISISDMKYLTIGMVIDMLTESSNDQEEYDKIANQEDIDNFF